jgi:hypothetical protein
VFVVAAMVATAALFAVAGEAGAQGKPVKIVLTCGGNVGTIDATLQMRILGGGNIGNPVPLSCNTSGTQSVTIKDAPKANEFFLQTYSWTGGPSTSCPTGTSATRASDRGTTIDLFDNCSSTQIGTVSAT